MKNLKITFVLAALVAVFTLTVSGNSAEKAMDDVRTEKKGTIDLDLLVIEKKAKVQTGTQA